MQKKKLADDIFHCLEILHFVEDQHQTQLMHLYVRSLNRNIEDVYSHIRHISFLDHKIEKVVHVYINHI